MKKALISIISILLILSFFGCGDSGVITNSPSLFTGKITGVVVDQDYNKVPGAYILAYKDPNELVAGQTNYYPATADNDGNFELGNLPAGDFFVSAWWNKADHDQYYDTSQCTYYVHVNAGQTIANTLLYFGYFYESTASAGAGNLAGRVFENAATAAGAYVLVYRVYENKSEIAGSQSNYYVGIAGSQGEYFIEDIPEGEIWIDIWRDETDHEKNYLTPQVSYQSYIYAGMTLQKDLQFGNMGRNK